MRIVEFRDCAGNLLNPQVEGDVLSGIRQVDAIQELEGSKLECSNSEGSKSKGSTLKGPELVGSVLTLGRFEGRDFKKFELKITNVTETPFWANCTDKDCAETFPRYDFDAKRLEGNCTVQLCAPGLNDGKPSGSISGTAVIFRGDLYDEQHHVTMPTQGTPEDDVFNIACMGTALSKLHLLRHTTASQAVIPKKTTPQTTTPQTATPQTTTLQKRAQAMLRLLTADYCGNGSTFTRDDLPIKLGFDNPALQLLDASKYNYNLSIVADTTSTIDALWTDAGATCIDTPRYFKGPIGEIQRICKLRRVPSLQIMNVPMSCKDIKPPVSFTKPYALGSLAISGNPPTSILKAQ